MPRPPLGPTTMDYTVKFRLSADEYNTLQQIAGGGAVSVALRQMIADEQKRRRRRK